jgi:hypothetical protein
MSHITIYLPSVTLLGMLVAGLWSGAAGIILARQCGRNYRSTTSIAGTIACAAAFVLAWGWITWASNW